VLAAWAVWATVSPWPDIVVGALICVVFFRSAYLVVREASAELRQHHARSPVIADAPPAARR
jgi:Co/Zn/Cd efflux system component